jgi:hypothetical protein
MLFELTFHLSGDARPGAAEQLIERMRDLGETLWLSDATWMLETDHSLSLVDAYMHVGLLATDRLRVFTSANVMTADGLSDQQRQWLAAHGVQIVTRSPFAVAAAARVENEINEQKSSRASAAASTARWKQLTSTHTMVSALLRSGA